MNVRHEINWRLHAIRLNKRLLFSIKLLGPQVRRLVSEFEDKRELILSYQNLMENKNNKMFSLINDFEGDLHDEEQIIEQEKLNKNHLLDLRKNYLDQLKRVKKLLDFLEEMQTELRKETYSSCYNLLARIHNDIVDSLNLEHGLELMRKKYGKPKKYTTLTDDKLIILKELIKRKHN